MALNVAVDSSILADALQHHAAADALVAVVVPAEASLRGAEVLAAMPHGSRTLWWQPDRRLLVVGSGVAERIVSPVSDATRAPERFGAMPLGPLLDRIAVVDPFDTRIAPRLVGGFSFFGDDVWEAFGPGDLTLPELAYVREGDTAAWIVVTQPGDGVDVLAAIDRVLSRIEPLDRRPPTTGVTMDAADGQETEALIGAAIDAVREDGLEKVVVARTATGRGEVDVPVLVDILAATYGECATFAFERSDEWFVGATPELLVRKSGSTVVSAALAATAPRHDDPVLDRIELESLQTSKQLEEHRLVVDAVVAALEGLGITTTIHDQQVMELRHVRHLLTTVEGPSPPDVSILDVVGALHPTPAVGGVPGSGALDWIRTHEGFTRGWYASPVGVVDTRGDGEFRVALRSARVSDSSVHLYAGAGIVAGSDPQAEMDEIDLKLGAMSGAIEAAR